jgi:hypothetical protein
LLLLLQKEEEENPINGSWAGERTGRTAGAVEEGEHSFVRRITDDDDEMMIEGNWRKERNGGRARGKGRTRPNQFPSLFLCFSHPSSSPFPNHRPSTILHI